MLKFTKISWILLGAICIFASCDKKENSENTPVLNIPKTYETIENVNFGGQTQRLDMAEELSAYMKSATNGTVLDENKLINMFENKNNPFSKSYDASKKLSDKCFAPDLTFFYDYFKILAQNSQSKTGGKNGTAGIVASKDGSKKYLFNENGFEFIQLIEKGIMGAVFYYQATGVYLETDKMSVDNTTVKPGEGTTMEHHWDEAFGYFGAPLTFPTTATGARFHAKYANSRNEVLKCNEKIMAEGFLKGRAAISAKQISMRDEAIKIVRSEWERVIASCAISYFNGAKRDFADDALRNHQLSEAIAFVEMLKYNPTRKITPTQIEALKRKLGYNLYEISAANIVETRDELSKIIGLDEVKEKL